MAWVEQREQSGRITWRVVWREDSKKQQQTFADVDEADEFLAAVIAEGGWPKNFVKGQGWLTPDLTGAPLFRDYARRTIHARARADERTRADYLGMLDNHINPIIGDRPIDQLTRFDVAAVGRYVASSKKSAKTVANVHGLLSSIIADAVEDEHLRRNIARGAMPSVPDVKTEEMNFLTHAEAAALLGYIPDGAYRDLVRFLLGTGMRWSEATAVEVHDVDLEENVLHVRRAWKYRDGHFVLGEPKTKRSRRTISISRGLADLLTPRVDGRDPAEFVFVTPQGRPVRHSNFYNRIWRPAVAQAVADKKLKAATRIHDCRHTHASWLLADKITLPAIQRRLGHESIQTTIDRYSHLAPEHSDEINASIDRALSV